VCQTCGGAGVEYEDFQRGKHECLASHRTGKIDVSQQTFIELNEIISALNSKVNDINQKVQQFNENFEKQS
jgi:hypothetical protein